MMFANGTITAAHGAAPSVTCKTCKHQSGRNNFEWTLSRREAYEICSHCRQELFIEEDDDA